VARSALGVALVGLVVLSACTEDDGAGGEAGPGPGERVTGLDGVRSAVVRITGKGTFVDPEEGELLNTAGSGSGFFVSPEGLVVTNNHVVTGAAFLEIHVDGEDSPRNGQVRGVSECSDLAVVDVEGEGFPYLTWVPDTPAVGTEVYAAGFPLGEDEYTLTKGIVSREATPGETSWASVDNVLQHDSRINPGNSGGPLVDPAGRVVGVNYAGDIGSGQFLAIADDEAKAVLRELAEGRDVTAIGVNGEAFVLEDGTSGIWVSSVDTDSPAYATGVRGGDVITRFENIVVGGDATMSDYCDVLRSNTADDVLSIEVLRLSTGELLAGQINGEPLEVTQAFADDLRGAVPDDEGTGYAEFVEVSDDTGSITVSVPASWAFRNGGGLDDGNGGRWPALLVAPDASAFDGSWAIPGAVIAVVPDLGGAPPEQILDTLGPGLTGGQCTFDSRSSYDDGTYAGSYDLYDACGGTDTVFVQAALYPEDRRFLVYLAMQATNGADLQALDRILDTVAVSGL
jgi:serine protease Do